MVSSWLQHDFSMVEIGAGLRCFPGLHLRDIEPCTIGMFQAAVGNTMKLISQVGVSLVEECLPQLLTKSTRVIEELIERGTSTDGRVCFVLGEGCLNVCFPDRATCLNLTVKLADMLLVGGYFLAVEEPRRLRSLVYHHVFVVCGVWKETWRGDMMMGHGSWWGKEKSWGKGKWWGYMVRGMVMGHAEERENYEVRGEDRGHGKERWSEKRTCWGQGTWWGKVKW